MTRDTLERIDACLAGTLDPADFAKLQQQMRDDPAIHEHYCRQAEMHGRLEWELGDPAQALVSDPPPGPAARSAGAGFARWAAAAALVISAISLGFVISGGKPAASVVSNPPPAAEAPEDHDYVARITRSENAVWSRGHSPGSWLKPGQLDLVSGSAEITFDCGASVLLDAGTRLKVSSPSRARLELGKATVNIPRQAVDFVFETPSTQLSQRMTRFGVVVEEDGQTEIHVQEGLVELNGKWSQLSSLMLQKDDPVRINSAGVLLADRRYTPANFPESLPPNPDMLPDWFLHWSFDSASTSEDTFRDSGSRPAEMPSAPAQVRLPVAEATVGLIAGRFGNAVHFNGRDAFLATRFPGIGGTSPRSVAFWIRLSPDTPETYAYSIISWGAIRGGEKWQLAWNTGGDNRGTRGAIRTEVGLGYHVGSTDLRDGEWHHVVSTFLGGTDARSATHIRHYVDGRLESTTATGDRAIKTRITGNDAYPVSIGRRIDVDGYHHTFMGDLDELYLFPVALTPEQIEDLYRSNTPPAIR